MAAKLIIAPEAEQDISEAYAWYENRRIGLGEEFLSCVDACIQAICRMPEMYAVAHENYRRGLVRRFPYSIFYEYEDNTVTVYCVFHNSRDPQKWRERLPL
ncbi:MAG: type II toxin-antitoxin system RelE/ParE family toxin [candidate division KSB1 bacterium]|nr:type II toxin-antitoxin system RelE/ParE family toxin [candidate division KSB1 bacterium]MDZ7300519.1 type II toxin-antitoxin system RelE/ParE family toxin [candidate division KSB1 bacterium]MDZ7309658.1 type II toxin-antitoxin system RelE/ParE family toxin [candidate division KSB1 bacterium]